MEGHSDQIYNVAIRLLARRDHSAWELRRKLTGRGFNGVEVDLVLEKLKRNGSQSDSRFFECFIQSRINKGYGILRIQAESRQHGIGDDIIDNVLYVQDTDWFKLAKDVRYKKYKNLLSDDFHERAKQARFLRYRGFTEEQINYALNES